MFVGCYFAHSFMKDIRIALANMERDLWVSFVKQTLIFVFHDSVMQLDGVIKSNSGLHQLEDQVNSNFLYLVIWERLLLMLL